MDAGVQGTLLAHPILRKTKNWESELRRKASYVVTAPRALSCVLLGTLSSSRQWTESSFTLVALAVPSLVQTRPPLLRADLPKSLLSSGLTAPLLTSLQTAPLLILPAAPLGRQGRTVPSSPSCLHTG